jgi:hypothetical protein
VPFDLSDEKVTKFLPVPVVQRPGVELLRTEQIIGVIPVFRFELGQNTVVCVRSEHSETPELSGRHFAEPGCVVFRQIRNSDEVKPNFVLLV